ncbi:hypothetical protein [Thiothrix subterranea]|uniref:hypothetical protein n=1 Tax=Thiothrix subterranea TaxID=2735563 RepID=UPI00280BE1DC|nr:hypothetical protein [Thiothrix subterranea]
MKHTLILSSLLALTLGMTGCDSSPNTPKICLGKSLLVPKAIRRCSTWTLAKPR